MGVYKRDNTWWVSYTYQGKQIRESSGTPSRRRAEQLLTKREGDGTDATGALVSSGVYFYRMKAGKTSLSRRMVLVK